MECTIEQREQQLRTAVMGWRVFTAIMNIVFAVPCLYVFSIIVPRFTVIFEDLLEGEPLPPLTLFFVNHHAGCSFFVVVAVVLSIVAMFTVTTKKWPLLVGVLVPLLTFSMGALCVLSLFMPLISIVSNLQ